jgi:WD40 repeat protein
MLGLIQSMAFSPDSQRLVSGSGDWTVRIWDATTGHCMATLHVDRRPNTIRFDLTGAHLLTGCWHFRPERALALALVLTTRRTARGRTLSHSLPSTRAAVSGRSK